MIKVGSFNIRYDNPDEDKENSWHFRKDELLKSIKDEHLDLCGLQEVLPHLKNDFKDYYFYGVCRDDGKSEGEMNPILVNLEKYDVLENDTFWLSDTPNIPSKFNESACTRIASWVYVQSKISNEAFYFINTHLDHESETAREKQMAVLKTFLKDKKYILVGDFNATDKDAVIVSTQKTSQDVAYVLDKKAGTFNDFDLNLQKMDRIDFIFASHHFVPLDYKTHTKRRENGFYLSDHFMISATLK